VKNERQSSLGHRLRQLRSKRGLTVSEVANTLGVSVSTYREWENGRAIRGEPYSELAKILHVTLSELLTGETSESSKILSEFNELEEVIRKFKQTLYSTF
jgi:transcriptional regulator with XRE-family HTH domain